MQRLEALRRVRHELQGEESSISLLKRDATNALVELASIDAGWTYGDREKDGGRLHPAVMFELQIAEELITSAEVYQTVAVQHGQQRFSIARITPGEPGIFPPAGLQRYWRFWLAPLEEIA
jgi:hypothetical protein